MAFLDQVSGRQPGEPQFPRSPGAPPMPSKPALPNQPGVATSPVGRPANPAPTMGGGAGASLPVTPARPPMPAGPSPASTRPTQMPQQQPQQAQPAVQPGGVVAPVPAPEPILNLDHAPTRGDMLSVPAGVKVMTPYGMVDKDGNITPTPETEQKFKEAIVQRRKEFGPHPFTDDPNAPEAPVRLGKPMINPFTGQWRD